MPIKNFKRGTRNTKGQLNFEEGHCWGFVLPNTKACYKVIIIKKCSLGKRVDQVMPRNYPKCQDDFPPCGRKLE